MAYRRFRILVAIIAVLTCLQSVHAVTSSHNQIDSADLKNIMLLKDIKPGMKGYGKTVFVGTKPETFQVEVLGVLKKANLGTDQILVKMVGGPMTKRGANLIRGMSGSPVYINGKIIGAFAYGQAFVKEPMGMVTPIECMLDAWNPKLPSKPSSFFALNTYDLDKPVAVSGHTYSKVTIDNSGQDEDQFDDGTMVFQPLGMPLMISGMSSRVMSRLQQRLAPLNIFPVAGPGVAEDKSNLNVDLQPGSAVAVSFITGDMDATGIGTVTYRRGNRILAFGHPMFSNSSMEGIGALDAPLSTAYVYDVLPNVQVSNKIAAPIKQIGRVFQDRPWAIAGEIGKTPHMIPVIIHVDDKSLNRKKDYNIKVVDHPLLTSDFIVSSAAEAVYELRGSPSDAVAKVRFDVTADEVGVIKRENIFFDPVSIDLAAVSELEQILSMLQSNPFHPVAAKKVEVWVDITSDHSTARLEKVFLKESKFEPGDNVEIGAVLKPYKGDSVTKYINLKLPDNMPDGQMSIQVGSGMARQSTGLPDGLVMLMSRPATSSGMPVQENLRQHIDKFLERDKNNELVAKITLPKAVPAISGEKLSDLPQVILDAMKSSKSTQMGSDRDEIKEVVLTDWVISGSQKINITVSRKDRSEKKSAGRRTVAPPPPSSQPGPPVDESDDEEDESSATVGNLNLKPMAVLADTVKKPDVDTPKPAADTKSEPQKAESEPGKQTEAKGEPSKSEASASADKPLIRASLTWKQTSRSEFLTGIMDCVTATTGDLLTISGTLKPLWESGETFVWCLLPDGKGNLYAGTGNSGKIYKVDVQDKASVLYDSPELQIHSLAMDSLGNLYAGTSPNGIIYKIDPSGKSEVFYDTDNKYITAMTFDSKGNLYAAIGDRCKVYKISPDGKASAILNTSENCVLALAADKDDNIFAGTGQSGIIYRIPQDGPASVIYDAVEDSVSALALNKDGVLYAGTGVKGVIYKFIPGLTPKMIYDKAGQSIMSISADANGNVYAVNASGVLKVTPDDKVSMLDNKHDIQFMSSAVYDGRLYAGTGNIGSIYSAELNETSGKYESPVHDCGLVSKWGVITWNCDLPGSSSIQLQTRTGNVAQPDSTWSSWSAPIDVSGTTVTSPQGRYIQYLAILKTENLVNAPLLKDVSIVYLPSNQEPTVTITSPKDSEKWSKKKTIKWKGTDPDKDTLTYDLFYSGDNGKTWSVLDNNVKTAESVKTDTPKPSGNTDNKPAKDQESLDLPDPKEALAQLADELSKHPEIPQDMKDRIMSEAPDMIQDMIDQVKTTGTPVVRTFETGSAPSKTTGSGTKETSFNLDTTNLSDGVYLIKVVCSDKLSNPVDALSSEAISEPVVISNKAPVLVIFKKSITVQPDRSVQVNGVTSHNLVAIAGVQYKIGSGDWMAAVPSDGIYDSKFEAFDIITPVLDKGNHTIEVKTINEASESSSEKVTVKID